MEFLRSIRKATRKTARPYAFEYRLRAVKLYLEEGVPIVVIHRETGVGQQTIRNWVAQYQATGQEGLRSVPRRGGGTAKLPEAVTEKIVAVKAAHPGFGVRRISQLLRRVFFLPGSPETVRRTLQAHQMMSPPGRKARCNLTRPRFFERATPNQLWQSDIFTFRLGGQYAYLIGYIDDYSRYITGLDLFRSQTAENVIEVYRRAVGEYRVPQEMLTDNGRQYVTWRGSSRFAAELAKDRVKHLRSSPHHPMTVGKMERFWKTIFGEFLGRAQFASFEEARERVGWWVRYYNHKRPHQGIGGLCPADRYFEIQSALKKTIDQGIQENILEMALRGKPQAPFYMVGRMDGQSVVLRAEKGQLRLTVDGEEETKDLVYNLTEDTHEREDREGREGAPSTDREPARSPGEVPGGPGPVERDAPPRRDLSGVCDPVQPAHSLGEAGPGGDAAGPLPAGPPDPGPGPAASAAEPSGDALKEAPEASERLPGGCGGEPDCPGEDIGLGGEGGAGETRHEGPVPDDRHPGGPERPDHGDGGGATPGGLAQDLLRVGEAGPESPASGPDGRASRAAPEDRGGHGEEGAHADGAGPAEAAGGGEADRDGPAGSDAVRRALSGPRSQ